MSTTLSWVIALIVTAFLAALLGGIVTVLATAWVNKPETRIVERKVIVRSEPKVTTDSALFTAEDETAFWSGATGS